MLFRSDRIAVYQNGNEKIAGILQRNAQEVQRIVLAEQIVVGEMKGYEKEWDINGENSMIGVERI